MWGASTESGAVAMERGPEEIGRQCPEPALTAALSPSPVPSQSLSG